MSSKTSKAPPTKRKSPAQKAREARARAAKEKAAQEAQPRPTPDTAVDTPKNGNTAMTFSELAEAYLESLRLAGKSLGTQFSYSIDLQVAVKHFGAKTKLTSVTERKITAFYESDVVCKTKTGRAKSQPTITKTRRVLRLALRWASEQKLIPTSPLPEAYAPRSKRTTAAK